MIANNPKKEYNIQKPLDECYNAALKISAVRKLTKNDPILHELQYHNSHGITAGYFVDFTFSKVSDNETKVIIESRPAFGAINTQLEMGVAQAFINEYSKYFSQMLQGLEFKTKAAKKKGKGGCMQFFYFLGIVAIVIIALILITFIVKLAP